MTTRQPSRPTRSLTRRCWSPTTGGVRTLTLNRPTAFNSFNAALKSALLAALADAGRGSGAFGRW